MGGIKIDAAGVSLHLVRNGRGRFYGCVKNFSQKSSHRVCPYTSIPQVFLAQSQHRMQKNFKKAH
jgi:hypothetical protein